MCTIEFGEIITSLLELLDTDGQTLSKELQITGLKILRKIIEVVNRDMITPAAEWDTDDWQKWATQIEAQQNLLVSHGCV